MSQVQKRLRNPEYLTALQQIRGAPKGEIGALKQKAAQNFGVSVRTIHRDLSNSYTKSNKPRTRRSSLSNEAEVLIASVIETFFLTRYQPTPEQAWHRLESELYEAGLHRACSRSTFLRRLRSIPDSVLWARRKEARLATKKFEVIKGSTPRQLGPLHRLQIDHQQLDVICVDSIDRLPVAKPWLTAAIDTYSGAVVGYHLGFDSPSRVSMALCLSHVMSPKEQWLQDRGVIDGAWPMWGVPAQIATDNAAEFRSADISRGYADLGMAPPDFRPIAQPQYGGMVERFFRTIKIAHEGKGGSTGRSVTQRPRFPDPERTANKTLFELDRMLSEYIACEYHVHRLGKNRSPLELWQRAEGDRYFSLTTRTPPDPITVFRHFLPSAKRRIQHDGVRWDRQVFLSEALTVFLKTGNVEQEFCRDPRDCRQIYLIQPETRARIPIPNRVSFEYPVSFAEVKAHLNQPNQSFSEADLLRITIDSRKRRDEIEKDATSATGRKKRERKRIEQQRQYEKSSVAPAFDEAPPEINDDMWLEDEHDFSFRPPPKSQS